MAKKKKFSLTPIKDVNFYLLVLALILSVGIMFSREFRPTNTIDDIIDEETDRIQYPLDLENDGIYTNHEYGSSFEYPDEVFTNQLPIFHSSDIGSRLAVGEEYAEAEGSIKRIGENIVSESIGIITLNEVERIDGTTNFSYLFTYEKNNVLYSLSINSNDIEKLEQYYDTFTEIIKSIEIDN